MRRAAAGSIVGIIAVAASAGTASAAMSSALETRVADSSPNERIAVIAAMHAQVDGEPYAGRRTALLRALRSTATRTQDGVTEDVSGPVRHFWLVNALSFSGTPDEVRAVAADPAVASVDLDHPVRVADDGATSATPYPNAPEGSWGVAAINAPQAWSRFGVSGAGVRVGNIDTGVNASHPDLAGRVVAWRDFVGGSPTPYDDNGHGTHTAGAIAGGSAGGAPIGVAPGASLVVAKGMAANGSGPGSALLAAAEWMTDPDGNPATADQPSVVNNSWSSSSANDTWFRPMVRRWRDLGILPIFSAGNTGPSLSSLGSPASYPEVVAVGAVDRSGAIAPFSGRGPVMWQNLDGLGPAAGTTLVKPDVVAPGVGVVSSVGDGYLAYSGTSMASPQVAGLVALIHQAAPQLGPDQIADVLRSSAVDLGPPGPDGDTGHGRIDAVRALEMAVGAPPAPPATSSVAAPTASFVRTPPGVTADDTVRYTVSLGGGATLVRTRVDNGRWGGAARSTDIAIRLTEGRHVVEAQGLTDNGVGTAPVMHVVTIDRTPPKLRLHWRRARGRVSFVAKASDPNGVRANSVKWSFGAGDTARGQRVIRGFADDARRRILVTASDSLGNTAYVSRRYSPRSSAAVRALRVRVRGSGRRDEVAVSGSAVRPVRLSVRLRHVIPGRSAAQANALDKRFVPLHTGRAVATTTTRAARGRFALSLPLTAVAPGLYRVEIVAAGRSGGRTVRTIRVR